MLSKRVMEALSMGARFSTMFVGVLAIAQSSCARPASQLIITMDSDAPTWRSLRVEIVATQGARRDARVFTFGAAGSHALPASFVALPSVDARDSAYLLRFNVSAPAAVAPDGTPVREAQFSITRSPTILANRTLLLPVFFNMRCGVEVRVGCPGSRSVCTVAEACAERGQSCGDLGECVDVSVRPREVPPGFVVGSEIDASRADVAHEAEAVADARASSDVVSTARSLQFSASMVRGTSGFDPPAAIETRVLGSANGQRLVLRVTGTPNTPFSLRAVRGDGAVIRDGAPRSEWLTTDAAGSFDTSAMGIGDINETAGIYHAVWSILVDPETVVQGARSYEVDFDACVRHGWRLLPEQRVRLTVTARDSMVPVRIGFAGAVFAGSSLPAVGCDGAIYSPIVDQRTPVDITTEPVMAGYSSCSSVSLPAMSAHVVCGVAAARVDAL